MLMQAPRTKREDFFMFEMALASERNRVFLPEKVKVLGRRVGAGLFLFIIIFSLIPSCQPVFGQEILSSHFTIQEFNQKKEPLPINQIIVDSLLIEKLEELRTLINRPIIITSGYRTPKYNKQVGGVPKSQHIKGKAADIMVKGMPSKELEYYAKKVSFSFTQTYKNKPHLHVDVR